MHCTSGCIDLRKRLHLFGALRIVYAALIELLVVSWTMPAQGQVQYAITDLGAGNTANGINNLGQVAGNNASGPFIWSSDSGFSAFGPLPTDAAVTIVGASAGPINDSGAVLGNFRANNGSSSPFIWTAASGYQYANFGFGNTGGAALNNAGDVVGSAGNSAWEWFADGTSRWLGVRVWNSWATSINDAGSTVGYLIYDLRSAPVFVQAPGANVPAPDFGDGIFRIMPTHINNATQVVGYFQAETGPGSGGGAGGPEQAFLSTNAGRTVLGTLGGSTARAYSINNRSAIVGESNLPGDSTGHAFVYNNTMTDLNTLLNSTGTGWVLGSATDINDAGQIIGNGTYNGQNHSYVLTLTPTMRQVVRSPSVTPPSINGHLLVFDHTSGKWSNSGTLLGDKDTLVITPGWRNSGPNDWPLAMAKDAVASANFTGNIVTWDWQSDANQAFAGMQTPKEGTALSTSLQAALPNYGKQFHFVGHSLGSLIDRQAIDALAGSGVSGSQITDTILDAPEDIPLAGTALVGLWSVNSNPVPASGHYSTLDNYITVFGDAHSEAENVFLDAGLGAGAIGGHEYSHNWYDQTIQSPGVSPVGFGTAVQKSTYYLQNPLSPLQVDGVGELALRTALSARDSAGNLGKTLGLLAVDGLHSAVQITGNVISKGVTTLDTVLNEDGTPSYITTPQFTFKGAGSSAWIPIHIPANATDVSFNSQFENVPIGDSLVVGIDDTILYTLDGQYVTDSTSFPSGLLDISPWAGQDKELFIGLFSGTTPSSLAPLVDGLSSDEAITIDSIGFTAVPEPSSITLMLITSLIARRHRRRLWIV